MLLSLVVLAAEIFSSPLWLPLPLGRLQIASHPRSPCKSWRCGPKPWIYPLCWQPLIEPRLIRLMDDLEIELLKDWGCFKVGRFVRMFFQWLQFWWWGNVEPMSSNPYLFFYMSFCTHSSNLSCYCPAMVLQPAGISTKPATNLCMLRPCMTFNSLLSCMLHKKILFEITPSKLFRNFLIMSHQHHFLWVICHPKVIPRWTTSPLVFERRAFALCEWDVLTRSIAF